MATDQWFYRRGTDDRVHGPLTRQQLIAAVEAGTVTWDDLVCSPTETGGKWHRAGALAWLHKVWQRRQGRQQTGAASPERPGPQGLDTADGVERPNAAERPGAAEQPAVDSPPAEGDRQRPADRAEPAAQPKPRAGPAKKPRVFLSYGRADAKELVDRLCVDLAARGYEVWQDTRQIRSHREWEEQIKDGLRSTQVVIAVLSPHAVRRSSDPNNPLQDDSVCLDEIAFARYLRKPIVPVMAVQCEPPFTIFRLDYVDLCAWRESEAAYQAGLKKLLESIELALRGEVRYRRWDVELEPLDFTAYLEEKRRDFCGRQWLFDELDAWRVASGNERALLITGDPGVGKTAIVAQLVHRNPHGQVLAYHCCQADSRQTLDPGRFVRSIAAMIASRLDGYAAQLETPAVKDALSRSRTAEDPGGALEEGVLVPLERLPAPEHSPRYILIDALDEALLWRAPTTIVNLLATRIDRFPAWLRIVATTRKEPEVLNRLRGLRAKELDAHDPRNLQDIDQYVRHRLDTPNLAERLVASRTSAEQVCRVLREKSEGNFLYVRQALDGIERDQYRLDELERLPPGLYGLYQSFFERLFPDEASYVEPCRLLQVLVAAAEPLDARHLAEACGWQEDRKFYALLRRLAQYLRQTRTDGAETYTLYHKSLADWLSDPQTRFFTDPREGHRRLADLCWQQLQGGKRSLYALRHLPGHLVGGEEADRLAELLTDLRFLESKHQAGLVFELLADLTNGAEALPEDHQQRPLLKLLAKALGREIHFIDRHREDYPQGLFQCLWNHGWWYDCPQADRHYEPPAGGWRQPPPWRLPGPKLHRLLERWRAEKEQRQPGFFWLRGHRPPALHLASAQWAVLRGHERWVTSVSFSPDSRQIATGSWDRTVRVWDAESGAELAVLRGHERAVTSVSVSPDGRRIASCSDDKTLRVWDAESGAELAVLRGHEHWICSVSFSPDGRRIASASDDKTVRVWDAETGAELAVLRGHSGSVTSVSFSPDGRRIATGSWDDKTVRVWDARTFEHLEVIEGRGDVAAIAAGAGMFRFRALARGLETVIEDAATGKPLAYSPGIFWSIATHPTGRTWAGPSYPSGHLHIITLHGDLPEQAGT